MGLNLIDKYTKLRLWIKVVLKEKNDYKLPLKDKIISIRHNFPSDLYHMYNLNKSNISEYIPEYERYLSREIDGEYKVILDNKILFNNFFEKYLCVPKILSIIFDKIYDNEGRELSRENIIKLLKNNKIIMKPISGTGGGQGVHLLEYNNDDYYVDDEIKSEEQMLDYLNSKNNYILTEFINQHEYSYKIFSGSTNTIRVITLKDPSNNSFIIPLAVHRWGTKNSEPVDNASKGGLITEIDVSSGELGDTKTFSDLTSISNHPNSKELIKGVVIPNWNIVKEQLINVASKMPYIPFVAWDIVITEEGFSVIEANASSGLNIFQIFNPIINTKLGEFYRHYGIIK